MTTKKPLDKFCTLQRTARVQKTLWSLMGITAIALLVGVLSQASEKSETGLQLNQWRSELQLALSQNNKSKAEQLFQFENLKKKSFGGASDFEQDRNILTKARNFFAEGKYKEALEQYNRISKTSDYWLEAVEEKSWSYLRMGDYEKSLAQVRTLITPVFVSAIGPEPFLLKTIAELKICDYKGMFATLREFKSAQKQRLESINQLSDSGDSKELQDALQRVSQFPIDSIEIGKSQKLLPRLFYLDREVQESILQIKINEEIVKEADEIVNSSESSSSNSVAKIILNSKSDSLRKIKDSKEKLRKRMRILAQQEAEEYYRIVQKLQLAEVEVTQRVFADSGRKISKSKSRFTDNPDDLTFIDNGEVWIDDLDKYEAKVNACESNLRRKM